MILCSSVIFQMLSIGILTSVEKMFVNFFSHICFHFLFILLAVYYVCGLPPCVAFQISLQRFSDFSLYKFVKIKTGIPKMRHWHGGTVAL